MASPSSGPPAENAISKDARTEQVANAVKNGFLEQLLMY